MAETDGITQTWLAARKIIDQGLGLGDVTCDTAGMEEAKLARAAISDAIDARILTVLHERRAA